MIPTIRGDARASALREPRGGAASPARCLRRDLSTARAVSEWRGTFSGYSTVSQLPPLLARSTGPCHTPSHTS
eukprot:6797079-Prymnesium_polylepis.1